MESKRFCRVVTFPQCHQVTAPCHFLLSYLMARNYPLTGSQVPTSCLSAGLLNQFALGPGCRLRSVAPVSLCTLSFHMVCWRQWQRSSWCVALTSRFPTLDCGMLSKKQVFYLWWEVRFRNNCNIHWIMQCLGLLSFLDNVRSVWNNPLHLFIVSKMFHTYIFHVRIMHYIVTESLYMHFF